MAQNPTPDRWSDSRRIAALRMQLERVEELLDEIEWLESMDRLAWLRALAPLRSRLLYQLSLSEAVCFFGDRLGAFNPPPQEVSNELPSTRGV